MKCPECGKNISENAEICSECGCPIKRSKNKQINKKVIIISLIIILGVLCALLLLGNKILPNLGTKKYIKIAKNAEILDFKKVKEEISDNGAVTDDYDGKWYIYTGIVTNIQKDECSLYIDKVDNIPINLIEVYLSTEDLKTLRNDQAITVVGKLDITNSDRYILTDAFLFPKELYDDDSFIIDLISYNNKGYSGHYYTGYKYNDQNLPIEYIETYYAIFSNSHVTYNDLYTLSYNNDNKLESKLIRENGSNVKTTLETYTYNADGFIDTMTKKVYGNPEKIYKYTYEKNEKGEIIKGTQTDGKNTTTLEYDKDGKITKEIGQIITTEYKYDKDGRLISELSTYNRDGSKYEDIVYSYGVVKKR